MSFNLFKNLSGTLSPLYTFLLFTICFVSSFRVAYAQCNCDHTITPADFPTGTSANVFTWDGAVKGVQPGQTICFTAGTYTWSLRMKNIIGSSAAGGTVTIKNCNGQAIFNNVVGTDNNYPVLEFSGSKYFKLSGKGASGVTYGIKITGSEAAGVNLTGYSTDFEVENLEVGNVQGSGIMSKTDPSCSDPDVTDPPFVQRNSFFHDNYVHHTGDEGFYIGFTHYPSYVNPVDNGCKGTTFISHDIENLKVYNNRVEYTEWDGIQIGATISGEVYGNTIKKYGLESHSADIHGIQLGDNINCNVHHNKILPDGPGLAGEGCGIVSWAKRAKIYNNLLVRTGRDILNPEDEGDKGYVAIQIYDGDNIAQAFQVYNNTIVDPARGAISMFSGGTGHSIVNNLMVQAQARYITAKPAGTTATDNLGYTTAAPAGFSDSDYHLSANSPAVDEGTNLYAQGVIDDLDNNPRPSSGLFDVGAYEYSGTPKFVRINFRSTTPAPAGTDWNDWNVTPTSTGLALQNIKYTDGAPTSFVATITSRFSGGNALGSTSTSGIFPADVMQTNWYIQNTTANAAAVTLTGLDNTKKYTFTFFGSRTDTGTPVNRTTVYRIGNLVDSLDASNNSTATAEIPDVVPTNGTIQFTVKYGTGVSFGYINAVEIKESPGGSGARVAQTEVAEPVTTDEELVRAYPVPFHDRISLSFGEKIDGDVSIAVHDMNGRLYFRQDRYQIHEGDAVDIDLSKASLSPGLNIVRIKSSDGYEKVIKIWKKE
jgi:hypothetical protein